MDVITVLNIKQVEEGSGMDYLRLQILEADITWHIYFISISQLSCYF